MRAGMELGEAREQRDRWVSANESAAPIRIDLRKPVALAEPSAEVLRKADHLLGMPQEPPAPRP